MKGQRAGLGHTAGLLGDAAAHGPQHIRQLNIKHAAAFTADEMGMGVSAGIVTLLSVHMGHTHNEALLSQHSQITIDRAQTEFGNIRLESVIDHFRCGMLAGGTEQFKNGGTFLAVFPFDFHVALLYSNSNHSYY